LLQGLATSPRWRELLSAAVAASPSSHPPEDYLAGLLAAGASSVDIWESTYFHILDGPDAVLEWIRGTGMRPVLAALEARGAKGDTDEFMSAYATRLAAAYPRDAQNHTIFPFRRIFAVASGPA
jgi:trans-aconitate 2-methyltransferase